MNKIILRLFSFVVIFAILLTSISSVAAVDSKEDTNIKATYDESDEISFGEAGGYLIGNLKTTKKLYADRKFSLSRGHGFAAENGNNLYDSFRQPLKIQFLFLNIILNSKSEKTYRNITFYIIIHIVFT